MTIMNKRITHITTWLAFVIVTVFYASVNFAQTYTPVAYEFQDYPFENATTIDFDPNLQDVPREYTWMAANGYGQWVPIVNGSSSYWSLLSNASFNQNGSVTPPIPHGTVAMGNFNNPPNNGQIKVAANLAGSVRYVWLDAERANFIIEGFNDQSFGATTQAEKQIDISINGLPKAAVKRAVIKAGIFSYPSIPVTSIVTTDVDPEWINHFDIAMDKKFLYIVFTKYDPTEDPVLGTPLKIHIRAVDLITGVVHSSYGDIRGFRPTIACDVRNAPENPTFNVGYLYPQVAATVFWWYGFQVLHLEVINGISQGVKALPKQVYQPLVPLAAPDASKMANLGYGSPIYQCRILVSSLAGNPLSAPAISMYILKYTSATTGIGADLIYHKYVNPNNQWATMATYADGWLLRSPRGGPAPEGIAYRLEFDPIRAFANPYDGKADNNSFHEFHCLYRIRHHENEQLYPHNPLCIIREDDNGITDPNDPDTREIVSAKNNHTETIEAGSNNYNGAANQMGVHVRWYDVGTSSGNYSRDMRELDEDIEENTLATYDVKVSDGLSHLGTNGTVTLLGGKQLTLWTDPNFAVSTDLIGTSSGIYLPTPSQPYHHCAHLLLLGEDMELNIGQGVGFPASYMFTYPNFKFTFADATQKLKVNRSSSLHHAGYIKDNKGLSSDGYITGAWTTYTHFEGSGAIELIGGGRVEEQYDPTWPPLALIAPAKLEVEGGAVFRLPETIAFTAENSIVDLLYNQNIAPVYGDQNVPNINETGRAYFHGPVNLEWCEVYSAIPATQVKSVLFVKSCIDFNHCTTTQGLTTTNCLFKNADQGAARLRLDHQSQPPTTGIDKICTLTNGLYDAFEINIIHPTKTVSILSGNFDNILTSGIHVYRTPITSYQNDYDEIFLDNNYFFSYLNNNASGILVENFNKNSSFDDLWITDNTFLEPSSSLATNDRAFAAIYLANTAAVVMHNTIEDADDTYANGIYAEGPTSGSRLNSFICNNFIYAVGNSSGTGAGLYTRGWNGIAKLNEISYCDIGHVSDNNDIGSIVFSNYHDNTFPGLKMIYGANILSLQGNHDSPSNYAAYDTIAFNNKNVTSGQTSGQIDVRRQNTQIAPPQLYLGSNQIAGIDTWGRNNIVSNYNGDNFIYSSIPNFSLEYINKNFWAYEQSGSIIPVTLISTNYGTYMVNVTYPANNPVCDLTANVPGFNVYCGVGFDLGSKDTQEPQTQLDEPTKTECESLFNKALDYGFSGKPEDYQKQYDTAKKYVELCANIQIGLSKGERGFSLTGGGNGYRSEDPNRYIEYRDWLKSVLYLNPDSAYYCADVDEIIGTFVYNPPVGYDFKAMEAIMRWAHDSGKCVVYYSDIEEQLAALRKHWHQSWVDTSYDTTTAPWDTTNFPNIDDLDLSILRGTQGSVNPIASNAPSRLGTVTVERNPFTDEVALKVQFIASTMLRLDIFDELGKQVYAEGLGYNPQGEHRFIVDSHDWSFGTYYARISTSGGEVRTVMLVKQ
jgi:hypothetical protein